MATPEEMQASMIANLEEKTGRPLAEWFGIVRSSGLEKHMQKVGMLKTEYGVTHGYANTIVHLARNTAPGSPGGEELVRNQYAKKPDLFPLYEVLAEAIRGFGDDVELAPKKSYVSLRRSKQFAILKPSTKTRLDVGIQLKGEEPSQRLRTAGSSMSMVSHEVGITALAEIDDELIGWLREAYARA